MGKTEEALAMVNRALKMNPDDEALKIMKTSLTGAAVSPGAEKRIEEAAKQQTAPLPREEDFEELKARGIEGFQNRQYQEASTELTKALSLKKDRGVYLYLAYAQMGLKQTVEAEETLSQAIAAFPGEPRFYQLYARHLAEKGDTKGALSMVEKGLKAAPDNAGLKSLKEILERER
jgi:Flp pilus assembly protein TadD